MDAISDVRENFEEHMGLKEPLPGLDKGPLPADVPSVPDRRAMERIITGVHRVLRDKKFESEKEMNAFLRSMSSHINIEEIQKMAPESGLEVAQDVMYRAFESRDPQERVQLARRALEISPDCADAYCVLAEETARGLDDALEIYQKGMEAGERALGKPFFMANKGHFWGLLETRPYMRAKSEVALCLWKKGQVDHAIRHYEEMLELNPQDNQGMRYVLASLLARENRYDALDKHLSQSQYKDDCAAEWLYTKALTRFAKEGDSPRPVELLRHAAKWNKYVLDYLVGGKTHPARLPECIQIGGDSEAQCYAADFGLAWKRVPGALGWLRKGAPPSPSAKIGRNDICPCGSGKKYKKCCGAKW